MQFLHQWTICVCISLLCASVLSVFEPKGSMKNFYRVLISMFIFISFLYPIKNYKMQNNHNIQMFSEEQHFYTNNNSIYKRTIENAVINLLNAKGVIGATVNSNIYINNDNEIEITEVSVSVPNDYNKSYVEELIFNNLGIKAKVINTGE